MRIRIKNKICYLIYLLLHNTKIKTVNLSLN